MIYLIAEIILFLLIVAFLLRSLYTAYKMEVRSRYYSDLITCLLIEGNTKEALGLLYQWDKERKKVWGS